MRQPYVLDDQQQGLYQKEDKTMHKVIAYALIKCSEVDEHLNDGWQPWGSALLKWDGHCDIPHQPMVKYDEDCSSPRSFNQDWQNLGSP